MSSSKTSLSFFLVFTLLSTLCFEIEPAFDYYILATHWTPTFCRFNPCIPNASIGLLIHGLWPSNITGYQPQYCNRADKFDYQNVVSLEPKLSNQWPDLLRSSSQQFWADQWDKHGTCSGLSQFDYFDKALKVFESISPMTGLYRIPTPAYRPGNWFIPINLVNDWEHQYGYFPKITCSFDHRGRYELFFELHYNVSVAWNPTDGKLQPQSIINVRDRNSCWRNTVYFPN
ncbi:Ribonuclease [Thalictrum thalictroides]|uniref:Ribonuclease n=1 Tax=Thalictrum thalictroides TaxID=46969 RepID=A0A7J6X1P2_THATH|nr:Ribonuclease [Thalictrum thalictroides]